MGIIFAITLMAGMTCARAKDDGHWPDKPVLIVVPSSPGGGTDFYARLLAQYLTKSLEQSFVVQNVPGASGIIGAGMVARAKPDGYTFLITANPALTINPSLFKKLPYDADNAFAPITRGVTAPMVLVTSRSSPAKTFAELIAAGKSKPGKIPYASAGFGTPLYLGVRMLEEKTRTKFLHVPYKGVGALLSDLLAGQVQFAFPDIASSLAYIKAGELHPLAVTQKTSMLPDVPTFADLGIQGIQDQVLLSFSVVAPAGTPTSVIQRMSMEIAQIMRMPEVASKLAAQVLVPVFDTPQEFSTSLKAERKGWAELIRRNNIKINE